MTAAADDAATDSGEVMRALVRHQWVRVHGAPRISVLVGDVSRAAELWATWARLGGVAEVAALYPQPRRDPAAWIETTARAAARLVEDQPARPVGVAVSDDVLAAWRAGRDDRIAALIGEGVIAVAAAAARSSPPLSPAPTPRRAASAAVGLGLIDTPRSLAELTLFEALEATPATAGKFRLNQHIPVRFGGSDAEIDLLARDDAIAIEIDGVHHFADPDCYRRDRRKDALLQAHGLAVLRVLAEDVLADPRAAVRMVCELMAHRHNR